MTKIIHVSLIAVLIAILASPDAGMAYRPSLRHKGAYHLTANTALLWDPVTKQRFLTLVLTVKFSRPQRPRC